MALQILYDAKFDGAQLEALKDGALFTTGVYEHATEYGASKGIVVTTTGYYYDGEGDTVFLQTTEGYYLIVHLNSTSWGAKAGEPVKRYSVNQAQKLVDTIIRNNKTIICNNILCARFAYKLTAVQREQLYELQNRLEERDNALRADGLVTDTQEASPEGYQYLKRYLDEFMQEPAQVGSVTVAIIVAAVVIASLSTAAYFAYKYFATQSEDDVKFSKELTRTLTEKLTEEEYQQLMQETKGIVTKARIKQSLATVGGEFKLLGIAAAFLGGYMLYKRWQD